MTLSAVTLRRSSFSRLALGAAACALLAACSNAPTETPTVTQAATAYDAARNDPQVVSSAPLELQRAEQALKAAQDSQAEGEDVALVDHQAYLAQRRADIASQTAQLKDAEQEIEQANLARDQALLGARTGQVQSLQRQLDELQAKQTDRGMVLTLGDVLFETVAQIFGRVPAGRSASLPISCSRTRAGRSRSPASPTAPAASN